MADGGSVEVQIRAKLDELEKDLAEAKKLLDQFAKSTSSVTNEFAKLEQAYNNSAKQAAAYAKEQKVIKDALDSSAVSKERADKLLKQVELQYGKATLAQRVFAEAASGVKGQLVAMAAGAGPVGVFLSSIPGWGLPAALALSAVGKAFNYITSEAARMGDKAIGLRRFFETTGLSMAQFKLIKNAASDFGFSAEAASASFERLTFTLGAAQRSSGQLYDSIKETNPALAQQLSEVTDTASGVDVLAKAWANATTEQEKARIARAAFGRQGAGMGPALGAIDAAGGLASLKAMDSILESQNKRWAEMRSKTDDLQKNAKNILASIFTEQGLQSSLRNAQHMKLAAEAVRDVLDNKTQLKWYEQAWVSFNTVLTRVSDDWIGVTEEGSLNFKKWAEGWKLLNEERERAAKSAALKGDLGGTNLAVSPDVLNSWNTFIDSLKRTGDEAEKVTDNLKKTQDAAVRASKESGERLSFLGPAASIAEQYADKIKKLNAEHALFKTGTTDAATSAWYLKRATDALNFEQKALELSTFTAALGSSATVAQQTADKLMALQKQQNSLGAAGLSKDQLDNAKRLIVEQTNGTYALKQQNIELQIQKETFGASAGAAESYRIIQSKMRQNVLDGKDANDGLTESFVKQAQAIGGTRDSLALMGAQYQATFDLQTAFFSDTEKQVANVLKSVHGFTEWPKHMNSTLANTVRLTASLKDLNDNAGQFGATLVSSLVEGKSLIDSFLGSAKSLANTLAQAGTKTLVSQGLGLGEGADPSKSWVANALQATGILSTAGTNVGTAITSSSEVISTGIASASVGMVASAQTAGTTLTTAGAATGVAIAGPLALLAIAVSAAVTWISNRREEEKKAQDAANQAKEAWRGMQNQFKDFIATMAGGTGTGMMAELRQATTQMQALADAANKAGDFKAVVKVQNALNEFTSRTLWTWFKDFSTTIADMNAGLGANSPLLEAQQNVRDIGKTLITFVQDTADALKMMQIDAAITATMLEQASQAAINYALSLLHVEKPMSETATALEKLKGNAQALQGVLVQLGLSAADAAAIISTNLTQGISELAANFTKDLQGKINSLVGGDWVNQLLQLSDEFAQLSKDAASLGADQSLVDLFLGASAQKIINDAQLTGDAFQRVLLMFPQLTGVVQEFSQALVRSAADIASAQQSFQDQLFILLQDQSTLVGQLAVFDLQAQRMREEELAKGGQAMAALEALLSAQRLDIIKKYNAQILAAQQQALDDAKNFLATFTNNIKSWLANTLGGSASPLSPAAKLSQASTDYNAQYAIALSGTGQAQRDALNSITQYATNLLEASKAYYGSSSGYQDMFDAITSQIEALPTQIDPTTLIVNAIDATKAAIVTMQSVLTGVLNTGNLQDIAATLDAYLPQIDTNSDNAISLAEMQAALGGTYSTGTLRSIFAELDNNGNGLLEKSELTKLATQGTNTGVGTTNTTLTAINSLITSANSLQTSANALTASTNTALTTANATLAAIQTLNNTASAQLTLLNDQYSHTPIATSGANPTPPSFVNNNMLDALNKIVFNTARIAANTTYQLNNVNAFQLMGAPGIYAEGGIVTGGVAGKDSVPILAMPGEFVIRRDVAQANADWLSAFNDTGMIPKMAKPAFGAVGANDNSLIASLITEVRQSRMEARQNARSIAEFITTNDQKVGNKIASGINEINTRLMRERAA